MTSRSLSEPTRGRGGGVGGAQQSFLREGPPEGPTAYPFTNFERKDIPLVYLLLTNTYLVHIPG